MYAAEEAFASVSGANRLHCSILGGAGNERSVMPPTTSQSYQSYAYDASSSGRDLVLVVGFLAAIAIIYVLDATSDSVRCAAMSLVGVAALAWSVRATRIDPRWLLLALVMEETLPYVSIIPLDPETGRWFIRFPLLLAFAIPAVPVAWRSGILRQGDFRLWLIYFAWGAITVAYSIAPTTSGGRLLADVLVFFVLAVVASGVHEESEVEDVLGRLLVGLAILQVLMLIALLAFPSDLSWSEDDAGILRFSGIFTAPNEVGAITLATVGVALAYWHAAASRWRRAGIVLIMAMSVVFAGLADSRSIFVALAVGCSGYMVWRYRAKGAAVVLLFVLAAGGVYASMSMMSKTYVNRDLDTLTGRKQAWNFEVYKVERHPILGYGYSVEGEIFKDRYFQNWEIFWDRGANTPLHNGYLSVAVGLGIPALALLAYLFLRPWISLFRSKDDPWRLKPLFFFIVLPCLILGFDETGVAEPRYVKGVVLFLCWMIAERRRIASLSEVTLVVQSTRWSPFTVNARMVGMLIAGILLLGATRSWAANFYIDAARGSDSNPGTSQSAPWKTLNKANHFPFSRGDVVHLARGSMWRETLRPQQRDDSNFSGVTFTAYGAGDPPTINGADALSQWSPAGGEVYAAPLDKLVYNVFVDQGPGWGLAHACCLPGSACAPSQKRNPIRGATCSIGAMRPGSWYWSGPSPSGSSPANTLYVWLPDGSAPSGHVVEAVTREADVLGYAKSDQLDNLTIDGLRLIEAGLRAISLQSGDAAGCCGSRGIGTGRGISGLTVRNCVIERTGTGQFDDNSYGNAITIINASAPVVENNHVSYAGNHGNCINVQNSNGARVLNNVVDHWNHNGIDIKGSRGVLVDGNTAHDQAGMGAGFYTEFSADVTFSHNRVYNVSNGFQVSVGTAATLLDNTIGSAATGIYFGPRAFSLTMRNNSLDSCSVAVAGDGSGTISQDHNAWGPSPRFMIAGRQALF